MSYKRKVEDKRRLKKNYEETKNTYGAGTWYDETKNRYIRYSCNNEWFKTHCRRVIRRKLKKNTELSGRYSYKKYFDYWWIIT